jgi:hypothetical protein
MCCAPSSTVTPTASNSRARVNIFHCHTNRQQLEGASQSQHVAGNLHLVPPHVGLAVHVLAFVVVVDAAESPGQRVVFESPECTVEVLRLQKHKTVVAHELDGQLAPHVVKALDLFEPRHEFLRHRDDGVPLAFQRYYN